MNVKRGYLSFLKNVLILLFIIIIIYFIINFNTNTSKEYMTNNLPGGPSPELSDKEEKLINHQKAPYYTHPFTSTSTGLKLLDNTPENEIKNIDKKDDEQESKSSDFTIKYKCFPSITGVFEDCGPLAYNGCSGLNPPVDKYRKHSKLKT